MTNEMLEGNGIEIRYMVDGAAERGLGVFEMLVRPDARVPPPHSHPGNEECVYVLEGTLRYRVQDETRELRPGEWMRTPPGSVHQFAPVGDAPVRALVIMTPDIGAGYFRDMFEIFAAGGPPDLARAQRVMQHYGVVPER